MDCKRCEKSACVRNGFVRGKQRWRCKECGLNFTEGDLRKERCSAQQKALANLLVTLGLSFQATGRVVGVVRNTVMVWFREFGKSIELPEIPEKLEEVEMDEMWHFLQKKEDKLWIWKATATLAGTTRLVDVQVGDRSHRTLTPLYERVESNFHPGFYATDDFGPYLKVLPQSRHIVGKELTFKTEQHNSDTRHWLARFRRKSKVVSHCTEMVRLSLIAVEYVHKGGGFDRLKQQISI